MELPDTKLDQHQNDDYCFGCGPENPIGLKLTFSEDGDFVRSRFTPSKEYQGWNGVVHGGILFTLLDEAGGYAIISKNIHSGVTAKSETTFKSPALMGKEILIEASITRMSSRLIETQARLYYPDGITIASSSSLWYIVSRK